MVTCHACHWGPIINCRDCHHNKLPRLSPARRRCGPIFSVFGNLWPTNEPSHSATRTSWIPEYLQPASSNFLWALPEQTKFTILQSSVKSARNVSAPMIYLHNYCIFRFAHNEQQRMIRAVRPAYIKISFHFFLERNLSSSLFFPSYPYNIILIIHLPKVTLRLPNR